MKDRLKEMWLCHGVKLSLLAALCLGLALYGLLYALHQVFFLGEVFFSGLFVGLFYLYPLLLTLINFILLFTGKNNPRLQSLGRRFERTAICLGALYTLMYLPLTNIVFKDWTEPLYNAQVHSPLWTEAVPTVVLLSLFGAAGYLVLSAIPLRKMPPLLTVLSIAAMYLGIAQCALWIVQVFAMGWRFWLCLLPLNCILISLKVIRQKVNEWNLPGAGPASGSPQISSAPQNHGSLEGSKKEGTITPSPAKFFSHPFLQRLNLWLSRSSRWPAAALLFALPLLGIAVALLVLFGQQPDSLAKAWTETSGWNLSQQVSPPNVFYDEHYLCTVAAGGHRRLVKPLRMGARRGHPVIVNRQLCIANAFEQVLEERLPWLHRPIRCFYDKYGFPLARHIRSPYAADAVYLLMKPLEWLFLAVLYAVDAEPEKRISVQYPPAHSTQAPSAPT